jgi:tetratricopeptide (TPR) repeat protein
MFFWIPSEKLIARAIGSIVRCIPRAGQRSVQRVCLALATAVMPWLATAVAQAAPYEWFTDQSSFVAALEPGAFTANGAALSSGGGVLGRSSETFVGTGTPAYGFTVNALGGLYGLPPNPPSGGIQPLEFDTVLTFQAFTPSEGVTAFGGMFSLLDADETRQPGSLSLAVYSGSGAGTLIDSHSLSVSSSSPSFLGLITYGGTLPITRATLTATTTPESLLPTAEQVAVGVPEPSTLVALSLTAVLLGVGLRLRKRAARAIVISAALTIVAIDFPIASADPSEGTTPQETAIEAAIRLRAEKKPDEALEVLRQATRTVKQASGDDSAELLPLYELATELLIETDAIDKAAALLEKSLGLHAKLLEAGGAEPKLVASHARAILIEGRLQSQDGRLLPAVESAARAARMLDVAATPAKSDLARAVAQLEAAAAAVSDLLGPKHESVIEANLRAGEALESIGRPEAAAARRATRLAAIRESLGSAEPDVLAEACHVAFLRLAAGRAADAIPELEAILKTVPPETRGYGAAVRTLGRLNLAAEQFVAARKVFLQAADIDSTSFGAASFPTLHDKLLAAMVAFQSRRSPPPIAELDAAVAALPAKITGGDPGAVGVIEGLRDAAEIALAVDRPQQARELASRGLKLALGCEGLSAADRIAMAIAAARPLVAGGDYGKAKTELERAVREAETQLGRSHPQTQAAVLALAECLAMTTPAAARPLVERLLASGAASPRDDIDERLARLIESVGNAEARDGGGNTAATWGEQLVQLRRESWGVEHPRVATTCLSLAGGRLGAGFAAAAIARCLEAIAIQEQALGRDHPEVAASLLVLADAHRRGGEIEEASAAAARSLAIWEAKAGPEHDATLAAVRSLAGLQLARGRGPDALPLLERLLAADSKTAQTEPARHARLLVRLAGVLATTEAVERSRRCLKEALALPCFDQLESASDDSVRDLALTLAEAGRVLKSLEDGPSATEAVRRARGLAIGMESPKDTLALIDDIAAGTKPLPPGRL